MRCLRALDLEALSLGVENQFELQPVLSAMSGATHSSLSQAPHDTSSASAAAPASFTAPAAQQQTENPSGLIHLRSLRLKGHTYVSDGDLEALAATPMPCLAVLSLDLSPQAMESCWNPWMPMQVEGGPFG